MSQDKSKRSALAELPLNTSMISYTNSHKDGVATPKRSIDQVEDWELLPRATRLCTASSQSTRTQESQSPMQDLDSQDKSSAHSRSKQARAAMSPKEEGFDEPVSSSSSSLSTIRHSGIASEPASSQETAATEITQTRRSTAELARILQLRLGLALFKVRTGQEHLPFDLLQMPGHVSGKLTFSKPEETPRAPKLLPAPVLHPTAHLPGFVSHRRVASSPPILSQGSPRPSPASANHITPSILKVRVGNIPWAKSAHRVNNTKDMISPRTERRGEAASCLLDLKNRQD